MNQEKAQPKQKGAAPRPPAPKGPLSQAPSGVPALGEGMPAKVEVDLALLSYSLARDLARVPREEWGRIESVHCRVPFTRDMADGIRFVDDVANIINQIGGLFATQHRKKQHDLQKCSEQIVTAFRALIETTVGIARKLQLTQVFARHWRHLSNYGPMPAKPEAARAAPKSAAPQKSGDAAHVA